MEFHRRARIFAVLLTLWRCRCPVSGVERDWGVIVGRRYRKGAIAVLAAAAITASPGPAQGAQQSSDSSSRQGNTTIAKALAGPRRGRPRKFNRPARAVTLTLPDDAIAALLAIDSDLSRAIVRSAQHLTVATHPAHAEVMAYGGAAVISVPSAGALKERAGVELVPLPDGRALISFDQGLSVDQIELRVRDALLDPALGDADRQVFEALAEILQNSRRRNGFELQQRSIIVLQLPKATDSQPTVEPMLA